MASDGSLYVSPDETIPDFELQVSSIPAGNLRAFTAILLAILIVVAFLGNLFLVATISSSGKLWQVVFNRFLVNVAIVNLLDTMLNMFASLLYVGNGSWPFGNIFCNINSGTVELFGLEMIAGIMLMAVDRAVALLDVREYGRRLTTSRTIVAIGSVWFVGLCYCIPIAIGSIPSDVFLYRYFCAVTKMSPVAFTIVLIFTYFACSWLLLLAFGVVLYRAHQERLGERSALPQKPADFTAFIQESRAFHDQLELGKFTLYVYVVYFVLQGPYLFLHLGVQVRNSAEMIANYDGEVYVVPPDAETLLTWLKFIYPVVYPFLSFAFCPEIWGKFIGLVCCRRANTISMGTSTGSDLLMAMSGQRHADCQTQDDTNVMTLVATSEGLHLRSAHLDNGLKHEAFEFADVGAPQYKTALVGNDDYDVNDGDSDGSTRPSWNSRPGVKSSSTIKSNRTKSPAARSEKTASSTEVELHNVPSASMRAGVRKETPLSSGSRSNAFVPKKVTRKKRKSDSAPNKHKKEDQEGKRTQSGPIKSTQKSSAGKRSAA